MVSFIPNISYHICILSRTFKVVSTRFRVLNVPNFHPPLKRSIRIAYLLYFQLFLLDVVMLLTAIQFIHTLPAFLKETISIASFVMFIHIFEDIHQTRGGILATKTKVLIHEIKTTILILIFSHMLIFIEVQINIKLACDK